MRAKASTLFFTALLIVAQPAIAPAQTYVSLVYGGLPCTAWTTRKAIEGRVYEAWIFGYASSYNAYVFKGTNVLDGMEIEDLRTWVDSYCKANPNNTLDAVARAIIEEQAKKSAQ
jgi:hypothetical protein